MSKKYLRFNLGDAFSKSSSIFKMCVNSQFVVKILVPIIAVPGHCLPFTCIDLNR